MDVVIATVLAGLEDVAADEINAKMPWAQDIDVHTRGKVRFFIDGPRLDDLLTFRSADNIYLELWSGCIGRTKSQLAQLEHNIAALELEADVRRWSAMSAVSGVSAVSATKPTAYVNASRSGKHSYSRFDAAEAALIGILRGHPRWSRGDARAHDIEFRLDVTGDTASLCLRLTPPGFKYRGRTGDESFSHAALVPTVAHSLVWMAGVHPEDVFVDPFCGSGTIAAERAAYPHAAIYAGDIAAEAVAVAEANCGKLGVSVQRWDAAGLPFRDATVDAVVTNLPWGRQILDENALGHLYPRFARELLRILKPTGRAVLLTDKRDLLERSVVESACDLTCLRQLSLKGLHPFVFSLRHRV